MVPPLELLPGCGFVGAGVVGVGVVGVVIRTAIPDGSSTVPFATPSVSLLEPSCINNLIQVPPPLMMKPKIHHQYPDNHHHL